VVGIIHAYQCMLDSARIDITITLDQREQSWPWQFLSLQKEIEAIFIRSIAEVLIGVRVACLSPHHIHTQPTGCILRLDRWSFHTSRSP
jgi:hypothetical protein